MKDAIIVIDIGMTNKKVAVYDTSLKQLDVVYKEFSPKKIVNPLNNAELCTHDLEGMKSWFFDQIHIFSKKYPIKAISVTTHGATFVCIDKEGKVCAPCIYYTEDPGDEFQKEFYQITDDKTELQKTTFTPAFESMINPAKGIYYLQKYFNKDFSNTDTILFYPQYWGFVLTGKIGFEPTYAGCHTYLWNHKEQSWSSVTDKLSIRKLMPQNYQDTCSALGTLTKDVATSLGLPESTIVTMGIHDSNASLLPYLAKEKNGSFVLNSTGTWCVSMHEQKDFSFNKEDLGKIVFFNQSAFCKPIKTSIFLGGMEFDTWTSLYKKINNTNQIPSYSLESVNRILSDCNTFLLPEVVHGSGQFTSSESGIIEDNIFYSLDTIQDGNKLPSVIKNEKDFIAILNLSLVIQTETALQRAGLKENDKVFTEGGFRKNELYNSLLATILPKNKTYRTSMAEATATGAAMTAIMIMTKQNISELADIIDIEYIPDSINNFVGYEKYKQKWLEKAEKKSSTRG